MKHKGGNVSTRCVVGLVITVCDRGTISPWLSENLYMRRLRTIYLKDEKEMHLPSVSLLHSLRMVSQVVSSSVGFPHHKVREDTGKGAREKHQVPKMRHGPATPEQRWGPPARSSSP